MKAGISPLILCRLKKNGKDIKFVDFYVARDYSLIVVYKVTSGVGCLGLRRNYHVVL
jgi:hypothetical protein